MGSFFKKIGKGILYVFVLPFYLVVLVAIAIFGLGVMAKELIKTCIRFFTGQSLKLEFEEDVLAAQIDNATPNSDEIKSEDNSSKTVIFINGSANVATTDKEGNIFVKGENDKPKPLNEVIDQKPEETTIEELPFERVQNIENTNNNETNYDDEETPSQTSSFQPYVKSLDEEATEEPKSEPQEEPEIKKDDSFGSHNFIKDDDDNDFFFDDEK